MNFIDAVEQVVKNYKRVFYNREIYDELNVELIVYYNNVRLRSSKWMKDVPIKAMMSNAWEFVKEKKETLSDKIMLNYEEKAVYIEGKGITTEIDTYDHDDVKAAINLFINKLKSHYPTPSTQEMIDKDAKEIFGERLI